MIKAILMIDCNICGQPFNSIATCNSKDSMSWKNLSIDLEDTAVSSGWTFHRAAHYCDYCMTHLDFELLLEEERSNSKPRSKSTTDKTWRFRNAKTYRHDFM
jgi:hypothetical protein